jgi:hypothetical protein
MKTYYHLLEFGHGFEIIELNGEVQKIEEDDYLTPHEATLYAFLLSDLEKFKLINKISGLIIKDFITNPSEDEIYCYSSFIKDVLSDQLEIYGSDFFFTYEEAEKRLKNYNISDIIE